MVVERHARLACPPGLGRFTFQQVGEAVLAHLCEGDPSKAAELQAPPWSGPRQGQLATGSGGGSAGMPALVSGVVPKGSPGGDVCT